MTKRIKYNKELIFLIGPRPFNDSVIYSKKKIEYAYPSKDLVNFSRIFSEEILINGKTSIDLSQDCTPEEFNCFNILLKSVIYPETSYVPVSRFPDYISGSIGLLLKTKSYKPIFDYFMHD
jgi:hypothetical protein